MGSSTSPITDGNYIVRRFFQLRPAKPDAVMEYISRRRQKGTAQFVPADKISGLLNRGLRTLNAIRLTVLDMPLSAILLDPEASFLRPYINNQDHHAENAKRVKNSVGQVADRFWQSRRSAKIADDEVVKLDDPRLCLAVRYLYLSFWTTNNSADGIDAGVMVEQQIRFLSDPVLLSDYEKAADFMDFRAFTADYAGCKFENLPSHVVLALAQLSVHDETIANKALKFAGADRFEPENAEAIIDYERPRLLALLDQTTGHAEQVIRAQEMWDQVLEGARHAKNGTVETLKVNDRVIGHIYNNSTLADLGYFARQLAFSRANPEDECYAKIVEFGENTRLKTTEGTDLGVQRMIIFCLPYGQSLPMGQYANETCLSAFQNAYLMKHDGLVTSGKLVDPAKASVPLKPWDNRLDVFITQPTYQTVADIKATVEGPLASMFSAVSILKHNVFLERLIGTDLGSTLAQKHTILCEPGQILIEQGSIPDRFADEPVAYLVVEGELEAQLDGKTVATLEPGRIAGVGSILLMGPRNAAIVAKTRAHVIPLTEPEILDIVIQGNCLDNMKFVEKMRPILAELELCRGWTSLEIERLLATAEEAHYKNGERIIKEGELAGYLRIILDGTATIPKYHGQKRGKGEILAEMAIATGKRHNADVFAEGDLWELRIPYAALDGRFGLLKYIPQLKGLIETNTRRKLTEIREAIPVNQIGLIEPQDTTRADEISQISLLDSLLSFSQMFPILGIGLSNEQERRVKLAISRLGLPFSESRWTLSLGGERAFPMHLLTDFPSSDALSLAPIILTGSTRQAWEANEKTSGLIQLPRPTIINLGRAGRENPFLTHLNPRNTRNQLSAALHGRLLTWDSAADGVLNIWRHLRSLQNSLRLKDEVTDVHSKQVTHIALQIAEQLGLSKADKAILKHFAPVHDLGKDTIPDDILKSTVDFRTLSETERQRMISVMNSHPAAGAKLLAQLGSFATPEAIAIVLQHHERPDGKGYPNRLKSDEITYLAKIVQVADVASALIQKRPYKRRWTPQEVFDEILAKRGTQFDPQVVNEGFIPVWLRAYPEIKLKAS
ncbi:MAG: HD domain-containing phosphohydrolase [Candidatus Margulisiibacteriota bacterium]